METQIKEFINMDEFEKIQKIAQYFVDQKALPKWVDNAWKLVMVIQAWRDLGLTVTQAMSGIVLINWIVTVYGNVGALMMKRAGYDWEVLESDSKHCKIRIWKWEKEDHVEYNIVEAQHAWIVTSITRQKYPQEMIYWKCLARARKRICPEVLDGVAIYEDYQELEKKEMTIEEEQEILWNFKPLEKVNE